MTVTFADLISVAQNRDEVCFGVKIKAFECNQNLNNGVELIREKGKEYTLIRDDCLIVEAENEL